MKSERASEVRRTRLKMATSGHVLSSLVVILLACQSHAMDIASCNEPLGMSNGNIPDLHITASSTHDHGSVGPHNARLRQELNGGAWCPANLIIKDSYEYLEINLEGPKVVTVIETQGRFGNGQGQEYAESYRLEYWRPGMDKFVHFRNRNGEELFPGNSNTYIGVSREVDPPITASKLRIIPFSEYKRTVCMRVEIYGCPWTEGIISYGMPQGEKRGSEIDLYDKIYDGHEENHYLYGGLGQLVDGQKGPDNFRLDIRGQGKGYEWVGWRNDTGIQTPIEIIFTFEKVRNFSTVAIYCNNLFSKDVQVFSTAKVYFSVGGKQYQSSPIIFSYMPDTVVEMAREVTIRLGHRIGRFVKVQLSMSSRWMMISEISFKSEPAVGNFTIEGTEYPKTYVDSGGIIVREQPHHDMPVHTRDGSSLGDGSTHPSVTSNKEKDAFPDKYIGIIVGVLGALLMLILLIVGLIMIRRTLRRKINNNMLKEKRITINMKDMTMNIASRNSNGNLYGSVALEDPEKPIYQDPETVVQGRKLPEPPKHMIPYGTMPADMSPEFAANMVSDLPMKYDISTSRKLPPAPPRVPQRIESRDMPISREYAIPDLAKANGVNTVNGINKTLPTKMIMPPKPSEVLAQHYAESELFKIQNIQGVSGNCVYAVPGDVIHCKEEVPVPEFPRQNLHFVEKLGEGQFGEVHLCEAEGMSQFADVPCTPTSSCLVAVKLLRKNATDTARQDFMKEVRIMAKLQDPNIVRVLGACMNTDPICVIAEYMENGDLNQFLQDHDYEDKMTEATGVQTLDYGTLIYQATQIASGMKYLESLNFVHRDLATRNCLVGRHYTIKIADFGMSRNLYSMDYYRIEGRAVLPIRWMAWESILLGRFTTKSDVWSFAVTLWEVLTFARESPYGILNDEEVIENVGNFYRNEGKQIYLPQPTICPKEIYDLMCECWQRNESERPNFREIHLFLQRKNLGYQPEEVSC